MNAVARAHERFIYQRRLRVLASALSSELPRGARVLDVGCGDGRLAAAILADRPDLDLRGVDVLARPSAIHVDIYDGVSLPYESEAFDAVMAVDMLHHTDDPASILSEMTRVARRSVVLKDHLRDGPLAGVRLRAMDWVGNAPHGVRLPYNYWERSRWMDEFERLDLEVASWNEDVPLYPPPASWVFGGSLHFVARLDRRGTKREADGNS